MANKLVEQLDRLVSQYEARVVTLRQLREVALNDPGLVIELQDILLDPDTNGLLHPERADTAKLPELTRFVRIKAFFESKGNEWTSIHEIGRGTNLSRNSVTYVLYTGDHAKKFEKQPVGKYEPKYRKSKDRRRDIYEWRLKVKTDQSTTELENEPVIEPEAQVASGDRNGRAKYAPPQKYTPKPKHPWSSGNGVPNKAEEAPSKTVGSSFAWSPVETGQEIKP